MLVWVDGFIGRVPSNRWFGWSTGDDGLLPTEHHPFPMGFVAAHAPQPDFFLEYQTTFNDENFLYDRNDDRIAFFKLGPAILGSAQGGAFSDNFQPSWTQPTVLETHLV